tara:strand:- start:9687 stop:11567 length:1881 start_codon:yes stop_codon:yes gene_type:complete
MAYLNGENSVKDVKYTHRDFGGLKNNLIDFAKTYFPKSVKDFTEASPSTMFIEMAAYVGDVLSYYTDYAMKETMLHRATEKRNIYAIAQSFGYKPRLVAPSTAKLDVMILIPATGTGDNIKPDFDYAPRVEKGMVVSTTGGIKFTTTSEVDFAVSSSVDTTDISVYSTDATTGRPEYYLFTKKVDALSGEQKITTINVGAAQEYPSFILNDTNVQSIESVTDSDGMTWTEVPFLAQSTIFDKSINDIANDPTRAAGNKDTPYILQLKTVKRRFITRVTEGDKLQLRFGSGITGDQDETIIPNPENIGSNLPSGDDNLDKSFDPSNFLYSDAYGQAPANTTLTVRYTRGYGLDGNVQSATINNIDSKNITFDSTKTLISGTRTTVHDSIAVTNLERTTGGAPAESLENVRQNALGHFATQNRMVTREDYVVRAMSMPSKFGNVAKAYVASDEQMLSSEVSANNPLAVNLYVLTYNKDKHLTTLPQAAKENLRTYLSQYRMLTDAINIKDGYIVNIGIDFEITVLPGHNSNEVLLRCIRSLTDKYKIDNMSFTSALYLTDIYLCLANIEGVQSVTDVKVKNIFNGDYSEHRYNLDEAEYQNVIYPSLDPSVFEIKFPGRDINGKVATY